MLQNPLDTLSSLIEGSLIALEKIQSFINFFQLKKVLFFRDGLFFIFFYQIKKKQKNNKQNKNKWSNLQLYWTCLF